MKSARQIVSVIAFFVCTYSVHSSPLAANTDKVVACVAQQVITSKNRSEFSRNGYVHYRFHVGGVPFTNQSNEQLDTVVLYSNNGRRALVASVNRNDNGRIQVGMFYDTLNHINGHWQPADVSGGPGTADAVANFLEKLEITEPVSRAATWVIPETECSVGKE